MKRCFNCFCEYEEKENICPHCGCDPAAHTPFEGSLEPGTVVAGSFCIGYAVKRNSFGFTYNALDSRTDEIVTVLEYMPQGSAVMEQGGKRVIPSFNAGDFAKKVGEIISLADSIKRFDYYEAIPAIIDFGLENDTAYVIIEREEGETVREITEREGKYSFRNTVADITPVIRAVDGLHREGILHGNITPDSIMICKSGKVKLFDFPLAFSDNTGASSPFTAPEKALNNGAAVSASDIFSICAVIYYMLTGSAPEKDADLYEGLRAVQGMPEDAARALVKGLSANPDDRQKEAEDVLNAMLGKKVFRLDEKLDMPGETPLPRPGSHKKAVNKPMLIISIITALLGVCFIAISIKFLTVIKANSGKETTTAAPSETVSESARDNSQEVILPAEAKNIYLDFLRSREFTQNYKSAYAVRTKNIDLCSETDPLPPGVRDLDKARFTEYFYDIDSDGVNECILITDLDGGFEYITLYIFDIDKNKTVFEGGRINCTNGMSEDLRLCTMRAGNASAYYFLRFTVEAFDENALNSNSFEALCYNGKELICVASAGADKYSEDELTCFSDTGSELTPDGDLWDPEDPYVQRSLYVYDDERYVHSPDEYIVIDSDTFNLLWMRNVVSAYTKVLIKSAERGNAGVAVSIMFPGLELGAKDIQLERRTPSGNEVFLYTADGRPLQFTRTLSKKDFREPYKVEIYYNDRRYVSCTVTLDNDGNPVYTQGDTELIKVPDVVGMRRDRAIEEIQDAGFENVRSLNGASHGLLGLFNVGKIERVNVTVGEYYPKDTEIIVYISM